MWQHRPASPAARARAAGAARAGPRCGAAAARRRAGRTGRARTPLCPYTDTVPVGTAPVAVGTALVAVRSCKTVAVAAVCAGWNRSWSAPGGTHCAGS